MSARSFAIFISVLAVLGLLAYGLTTKGADALEVGQPAPDKELERLEGDGTGRLADYRGRWVLLNFWASWCDPCRAESPALQRFFEAQGENVQGENGAVVLGVNLDDAREDARAFVDEYALTYPQLREGDGEERRDVYGMTGFPETFLIDPQGRIALIRRGPVDDGFLRETVQPLIAAGTAG